MSLSTLKRKANQDADDVKENLEHAMFPSPKRTRPGQRVITLTTEDPDSFDSLLYVKHPGRFLLSLDNVRRETNLNATYYVKLAKSRGEDPGTHGTFRHMFLNEKIDALFSIKEWAVEMVDHIHYECDQWGKVLAYFGEPSEQEQIAFKRNQKTYLTSFFVMVEHTYYRIHIPTDRIVSGYVTVEMKRRGYEKASTLEDSKYLADVYDIIIDGADTSNWAKRARKTPEYRHAMQEKLDQLCAGFVRECFGFDFDLEEDDDDHLRYHVYDY